MTSAPKYFEMTSSSYINENEIKYIEYNAYEQSDINIGMFKLFIYLVR